MKLCPKEGRERCERRGRAREAGTQVLGQFGAVRKHAPLVGEEEENVAARCDKERP